MAKSDPYHPDYKKVYAGTYISPEVMRVLKQSDRKMEYMEVDIKRERKKRRKGKPIENYNQGKELSLDKFAEDDLVEFVSPELSPEEIAIYRDEVTRLRKALSALETDEFALVQAVFFEQASESSLGKEKGISQQGVSKNLKKILKKLKILMKN